MRFFLLLLFSSSVFAQSTLDSVRSKGFVQCGVNTGLAGFSQPDSKGVWRGIDVDLCRAVAAAALGDASKVRFTPLTAQQRFTALQSGEVDILARNTTWTLSRDTSLGLNFVGVNYYDGQGFMVPKKLKVKSAKQLNGATVCVQPGTTNELNLADWFRANRMTFKPVVIAPTTRGWSRCARRAPPSPTTTSSFPRSSPRSRSVRRCAMAMIAGSTSSSGRSTR